MSDIITSITIPTDDDGYVLMQCPKCREYFKLTISDIEAEDLFEVCCPYCGLTSENYFTEDVRELAFTKVENYAMDKIYEEMRKTARNLNGKIFSFTVGSKPKAKPETPIGIGIDTLVIQTYNCCNKSAKITPSSKITGSYCPFCKVRYG